MRLRFWKRDKVSKLALKRGCLGGNVKTERVFCFHDKTNKELFRIHSAGKITLSVEMYEAAVGFWDIVKELAPQGYSLEVKKEL